MDHQKECYFIAILLNGSRSMNYFSRVPCYVYYNMFMKQRMQFITKEVSNKYFNLGGRIYKNRK